ncbi:MAG: UPF0182 family protein [Candidatus Dormibacteraeota bacterium]|nr:UPF0182 family protein [Candidatus Dormibacteraeota bacterium]
MSAFGFDPEQLFRNRRPRPRVVRTSPPGRRRRRIIVGAVVVALILLILLARWLLGLRATYLFYKSLGHTNVFWTPFVAQLLLFIIGFVITGALVAASVAGWRLAARNLDRNGARIVTWVGVGIAIIAGIAGGASLASHWQEVLLWQHGQAFGAADPVFNTDYSFFIFTLPVIDAFMALFWGAVIVGLLGAIAIAVISLAIENSPNDVPLPLSPPEGRTPRDALHMAVRHIGIALVAVLLLAVAGAHFGVYHLATSSHDTPAITGLDATQRNVIRPVLGGLQVVALIFAAVVVVVLVRRWRTPAAGTAATFGGLLFGWLIVAGLSQGIPAAIYQGTSVNPNAFVAQKQPIADFLTTSRYAWALEDTGSNPDIQNRSFGKPHAPTLQDISADPGTLTNVRIQDYRQLPDTLAQIDRSRSYQTYSTITVDRYRDPSTGGDVEVMLGPREIAEGDIPNKSFVNSALNYTHGYGVSAVSVNQVGSEGKPQLLVGQQPMTQVSSTAPPDLSFDGRTTADPSIYCGLSTTQPVVSGTQQMEFNYPLGSGDNTTHAGPDEVGIKLDNPIDKLAISVSEFGGFDLFLNNSLTADSRALVHREVSDRITMLAPFLTVDGDPYAVVDPESGHIMWVVDAYVKTNLFPESYQLSSDGTSYMRNAVKAVIDAKTCATTLYAVDLTEPITAAWNAIYPGLMVPLDQMSPYMRSHLRYPEDYFEAQTEAYSQVHVKDPAVYFNGSDRYQIAQEQINGQQQNTKAYYVEATLPGDSSPQFLLFQTFSPGASGSGNAANNMTAWLAAENDYATSNHPPLVAVRLNNADNVLGPLQFDNNINSDPTISAQRTLLSQAGSQVILGNVIVLPFNNDSFLYVRPFYVLASSSTGTSFPLLRFVIVGTQNGVALGSSFSNSLQTLLNTTQPIPGLATGPPTTTPSPGATPSPSPTPSGSLSQQITAALNQLIADENAAQQALKNGDFTTFGKDEDKVKADIASLQQLLAQQPAASPSSSASPSTSP